jgi:hypothetical protein
VDWMQRNINSSCIENLNHLETKCQIPEAKINSNQALQNCSDKSVFKIILAEKVN